MQSTFTRSASGADYFVLRPHRSLTWNESLLIFAGFAAVSLTIGIGFFLMGLTLILPFCGLEMLALGAAFYYCQRQAEWREVVAIAGDRVTVEKGMREPTERHEFQRSWVRVRMEAPAHAWYPARLTLGSHGRVVELGAFLCEDERNAVAAALSRAIARRAGESGGEEKQEVPETTPRRGRSTEESDDYASHG